MSRPGGVVVRAWARPHDAVEKPKKGERRKQKPPPPPPPPAPGRCPRCGEAKAWLRPGEVCAPCLAPLGAAVRPAVDEDDEDQAPPMRLRSDVMTKREWIEGLSAEAIVAWRKAHEVTLRALADHLDVSEQAVRFYEAGKNVPSDERQQKLLELLKGPPPFQPRLPFGPKPGKARPAKVAPAPVKERDVKPANVIAEPAAPAPAPEPEVAPGSHDPRDEAVTVPTEGLRQVALTGLALLARAAAGGLAALARRAEELSK